MLVIPLGSFVFGFARLHGWRCCARARGVVPSVGAAAGAVILRGREKGVWGGGDCGEHSWGAGRAGDLSTDRHRRYEVLLLSSLPKCHIDDFLYTTPQRWSKAFLFLVPGGAGWAGRVMHSNASPSISKLLDWMGVKPSCLHWVWWALVLFDMFVGSAVIIQVYFSVSSHVLVPQKMFSPYVQLLGGAWSLLSMFTLYPLKVFMRCWCRAGLLEVVFGVYAFI